MHFVRCKNDAVAASYKKLLYFVCILKKKIAGGGYAFQKILTCTFFVWPVMYAPNYFIHFTDEHIIHHSKPVEFDTRKNLRT